MQRLALGASALLATVLLAVLFALSSTSPLPITPRSETVLENVVVIAPAVGRAEHQRVVVRGGRIAAIEPAERRSEPQRYVLPGLIDMHVHLPPRLVPGMVDLFATLFLASGVTTVREVGSIDGESLRIAAELEAGRRAGPRILACGPILDGSPPTWPVARIVRDRADGEAVVRELASRGARCIKVYDGISADALAGVRSAARAAKLPVLGHLPASLPATEPDLDDVQHLCYSRCSELSPEDLDAFVENSAAHHIAHTPTLVVFEGQVLAAEAMVRAVPAPQNQMPRFWRETLWSPWLAIGSPLVREDEDGSVVRQRREFLDSMKALVGRLHRRGVRIHAGTDPLQPYVVPGRSLHREIELLVDAGLTREEALAAATWVAGDSLGVEGLGQLRVGAPADILILREDPTNDLAALDTLEAVIADGRLYPIDALRSRADEQRRRLDRTVLRVALEGVARIGLAIGRHSFAAADAGRSQ